MGSVLLRAARVCAPHVVGFTGLSLLLCSPNLALGLWAERAAWVGGESVDGGFEVLGAAFLGFVSNVLLVAVLTQAVAFRLDGRPVAFGRYARAGLRRVPRALAVALVVSGLLILTFLLSAALVAMLAGMVLSHFRGDELILLVTIVMLIAPLVLACQWAVAAPVAIVERTGPMKSIARSAFLTQGARWRIFALLSLYALASAGTWLASGLAFGTLAAELDPWRAELPSWSAIRNAFVAEWALDCLVLAYASVAAAVVYHDLRVSREGAVSRTIADVFD